MTDRRLCVKELFFEVSHGEEEIDKEIVFSYLLYCPVVDRLRRVPLFVPNRKYTESRQFYFLLFSRLLQQMD